MAALGLLALVGTVVVLAGLGAIVYLVVHAVRGND
jgi:hypothetical protein